GYNVIGRWPGLDEFKGGDHFDVARDRLLDILGEYRSHENAKMIVVYDAMYGPGIGKSYAKWDVQVVFTKGDQTAGSYFDRIASEMNPPLVQLVVVTSDPAEQWTVFSRGALRIRSRDFLKEVQSSEREFN
ncbi:YacP-like NYN domain-containing protein, partial [Lacticaseibacillus rhamnosus]|uniref:YacP-like NYN domain-containing protein n=1 Tax=Lacticaseibacillus rhamnosus TaxID=47715 RepID=UPI000C7CFF44